MELNLNFDACFPHKFVISGDIGHFFSFKRQRQRHEESKTRPLTKITFENYQRQRQGQRNKDTRTPGQRHIQRHKDKDK